MPNQPLRERPRDAVATSSKTFSRPAELQEQRVTPTAQAILEAVATYRFLTAGQLLRLGVTSERTHLYDTLRTLKHGRGALQELAFGAIPGVGRLASFYMLTPRGAMLLQACSRDAEPPLVHRKPVTARNDYFHRVRCVDFHITARRWMEAHDMRLDFFHTYYDPHTAVGKGRSRQRTTIDLSRGTFTSDAVFAFTDPQGVQRLCTFELYNAHRTKRVVTQLEPYLDAIAEEAVERAYAHEGGAARYLVVFDDPAGLRLACARLSSLAGFAAERESFYLATCEAVERDFLRAWQRLDGEQVTLF
jgi:hypothetical protein